MNLPDKRKRSGFVRVGSSSHQAMVKILGGFSSEGAEEQVIKSLASSGYIRRTYSLTEKGKQALADAITVKRRSRVASDFDAQTLGSVLSNWTSSK